MARTRAELIARVLSRLGEVQAGQDPSAEDVAVVDAELDSITATLAARNIVYVSDLENIEDEVFSDLSAIVADALADDFGLPIDEASKVKGRAEGAEKNLRLMARGTILRAPVQADYF